MSNCLNAEVSFHINLKLISKNTRGGRAAMTGEMIGYWAYYGN